MVLVLLLLLVVVVVVVVMMMMMMMMTRTIVNIVVTFVNSDTNITNVTHFYFSNAHYRINMLTRANTVCVALFGIHVLGD